MANLNKVFLIGNLTRDPELRQLPSGSALCSFSMAINRTMTLASGEQREEVCYVEVVAIGRQAEVIHQYIRKGSPLFVEGRLHYEQWDDRETGKKRSRLSVRVERSQFIGSPPSQQQSSQGGYAAAPVYGQPQQAPPMYQGDYSAPRPANPPPSFAPPPTYGNPPPAAPPAYGNPPPAAPPSMPVFRPLPETRTPAQDSAGETAEDSESSSEIVDDIPF
jgi:single-strand DNA-binding protein